MQIDMHYYGTYALARAAGLNQNAAKIIATSSQFVDDNIAQDHVSFKDGSRIYKEATAHHPVDIENRDDHDQRQVWVPFHFLPGNTGKTYTERLKCRIDSQVVQKMCDHHLEFSGRAFGLHLLGIAAHVYADTFSHYGFSGVSSRGNKVDNTSFLFHEEIDDSSESITMLSPKVRRYVTGKAARFFIKRGEHGGLLNNIMSGLAEVASGALGHGSVATYPDRPYLVWCFNYERPDAVSGVQSIRNNPGTYLEGCRALHNIFKRFAQMRQEIYGSGDGRDFVEIEDRVSEVLHVQADKAGRIAAWKNAASTGMIFGKANEAIPEYEGEKWNMDWEGLDGTADYQVAMELPVWRFYQAASLHRIFVLRDLLPEFGLIVS